MRDTADHWPEGYERQILARWGDALFADSPEFDIATLDGKAAERQFGYNNDFTQFLPLPWGEKSSDHGLMVVSHEYATPFLMFPGLTSEDYREKLTDHQIRAIMAALGVSIFEVRKTDGKWAIVKDGKYNRRIHMSTEIGISGPAAGDDRLKTKADPTGTIVFGTISNCNGGITPWGTMLSGEEGAMDVFAGDYKKLPNQDLVEREGWDEDENDIYSVSRIEPRFKFEEEPNEWMRFDWVVEIDPFDPSAKPVKRTSLGRMTHEGAQCCVAPDGRVAVFMGDDDDFEYIYRFVTRDPWNPNDRAANKDLLDHGTLSVAKFESDGTMRWIPLIAGEGPLSAEAGFKNQADVVLATRAAADLVGATPMDGPEGLHAADSFKWDVFILCGDPAKPEDQAMFHPATTSAGWFTDPDNLAVDPAGRLRVTTDGPPPEGITDSVYVMDTEGPGRALPKLFYIAPVGSEACSPTFTPDGSSVFLSIQHPGELRMADNEDATSMEDAGADWPDFKPGMPARPSLVVLSRVNNDVVGS
ncbi:PhoX family phosphatase [Rhizobium leguminosarum]|uniref:PhoX family protein n=1 Tax=Rhizobium leguminosarum TaxID=384 RepID=UPI0028F3FBF9|nr:PhoX family phosphatase [Rhizobium leguminosarum]